MTRVQIPAYTDAWMQGDRYGVLLGVAKGVARVRLDMSRRVVRVNADDCRYY